MDISPNQSLYINNLNDTLKKDDLRENLYLLFSTYGTVLDVVTLKTPKMRGQAHVVFKDVTSAGLALKACGGMEFFGKPMKVQYAKGTSDIISKLDGTYAPRDRANVNDSSQVHHGTKRTREESDESE